ncbi:hypothetical protein Taro_031335 [Colocasia esculenta]|uniref:Protein kinase domain-containing protein n=1 Tax=Colocasia esculenta TaxID=4460 RepID=A0A843VWF5_COLES|nr:hypothetical protein [Colocasia esculenta]
MEDGRRRSPKRRKGADMSGQSFAAGSTCGSEFSGSTGVPEVEFGGETRVELVHFDGYPAFTVEDLLAASTVVLGRGVYGAMHWATLDDGNQLAVRRLTPANIAREFEAGVNILGRVRHPNLLSLRAYYRCPEGEKKFLVFDYMPRGSLSALLHGQLRFVTWIDGLDKRATGPCYPIDWLTRLNIAIGITRGLHHLHTYENIVHGNLNSRNVLLDNHNNAKIADYGLSKLLSTATNSKWMETAWASEYRAPELAKIKEPSVKTDVYSLGVIMLELLTGKFPRKSRKCQSFPGRVIRLIKKQLVGKVFDRDLMCDAARMMGTELLDTLTLALRCVDPSSDTRPETFEVLLKLVEIKLAFSGATVDAAIPKGGNKPTYGDDSRSVLVRHQWSPKHRKTVDLSQKSSTTGAASRDEEPKPTGGTKVESGRETNIKFAHFGGHLEFSLEDLLSASMVILEKDICGTLYLAILEDGNQMVIRRLNKVDVIEEFKAEVDMLAKARHPNLLALKAYYYYPEGESKFLVFDYMLMGSLSDHLHVQSPCKCIDWQTGLNILIGITRGLHYLHTQKMVHGNLTSINVLLDDHGHAKIVNYGISLLMTPITDCKMIDTTGCLAPEFFELKKFDTKTDLYGLGVVMLELLTGKSPRMTINSLELPAWVTEEVQVSKEVFDPGLMEDSFLMATNSKDLHETLDLALRCVDPLPDARPDVQQVLQHLEDIKQRFIDGDAHADGTRKAAAPTTDMLEGSRACSAKEFTWLISKDALKEGDPISRPIPSEDINEGCSDNQDSHVSLSTAHPEGSNGASVTTSNMDVEARVEAKAGENTSTKGMDATSCEESIIWEEIPIEAHVEVPTSPPLISSEPDSGYQRYFQALYKLAYSSPPLPSYILEVQLNRMLMGLHSLGYPLVTWLKAATLVLELAKKREYIEHHIDEYFKAHVETQLAECTSSMAPLNEEVSTTRLNISTLEQKQKDLNESIAKLEEQLAVLKTQQEDIVDLLIASRDQLAAAEAKLQSLHVAVGRLKQESSVISDLRHELLRELPSLDEAFDFSFRELLTKKF